MFSELPLFCILLKYSVHGSRKFYNVFIILCFENARPKNCNFVCGWPRGI